MMQRVTDRNSNTRRRPELARDCEADRDVQDTDEKDRGNHDGMLGAGGQRGRDWSGEGLHVNRAPAASQL
jgi:hypothetical protein